MRLALIPVLATMFVFVSAPNAEAANVYRGDSWVNFINSTGDTSLVAGGDSTGVGNQVAAFGVDTPNITANPNDTAKMTSVTITVTSTGNFPGDSIITHARLYADPGNGQLYANNFTLLGTLTSATGAGPDTATYGFTVNRTFTSRETYVVMVESVNDSYVNGKTIQASIAVNAVSIFDTANIGIQRPSSPITYPIFVFKRDSPVISIQYDGDSVIHPDTRRGENPFKILSGSIQGETRTIGSDGDTVTRFGVALHGTGADSVDSVWVVLGPSESYSLLTLQGALANGDSLWLNSAINKRITGSNQLETFIVYARYSNSWGGNNQLGYPFLGETVQGYVPTDSIATTFRYNMGDAGDSGHGERADSSGLRTINRDTVFIVLSSVTARNVSPYLAIADSALVMQGRVGGGGGSNISYDTLQGFGVEFLDGGLNYILPTGFRRTTAESVTAVIVNFGRGDTNLVQSTIDSAVWFMSGETTIDSSTTSGTFAVYVKWLPDSGANGGDTYGGDTMSSNIPPGETMAFSLLADSVFTFFAKDSGGRLVGDSYTSGGTITFFNGDSLQMIDSPLGDITINPSTGTTQNPVLAGVWTVKGNAQNNSVRDTLTRIGFRLSGGAIASTLTGGPDSVNYAYIEIDSTGGAGGDSVRIDLARSEAGGYISNPTPTGLSNRTTEWHATLGETFSFPPIGSASPGTFTVKLYLAFFDTVGASGETLQAAMMKETTATSFTPDTADVETSSRVIRLFKPDVFVAMDSIPSIADSVSVFRSQHDSGGLQGDSIHVLKGRIGAGSSFDTLIEFGVIIQDSNFTELHAPGLQASIAGNHDSFFTHVILSLNGRGETNLRWGLGNFGTDPAHPFGDTVWHLDGDTNIDSGITFNVYVRLRKLERDSQIAWRGRQMIWAVRGDSIATEFSNRVTQTNDTTSAGTIQFVFKDTTVVDDTASLADIHINPDTRFNNDTILVMSVVVRGQTFKTYLGDTFETISFRLDGSAAGPPGIAERDSVNRAWVMIDSSGIGAATGGESRIDLRRTGDGWSTEYGAASIPAIIPAAGTAVLHFYVNMFDSTLANGGTLQAAINADSIRTFYASGTTTVVQSSRIVHFEKDTLQINLTTLADTTISPFQLVHDTGILIGSGTIMAGSRDSASVINYDTITRFAVQIHDSVGTLSGDSISEVRVHFIGGANPSETVLQRGTLIGGHGDSWYMLGDTRIDSVQFFQITIRLGSDSFSFVNAFDSFVFEFDMDSVRTQFTQTFSNQVAGAPEDTRLMRYVNIFYLDTVLVGETTPVSNVQMSPDIATGKNPVLAWRGTVRGQTYRSDLRDTWERFGFRSFGSALGGNGPTQSDSICSAWITIESGAPSTGMETVTLNRMTSNGWMATLDSAMPTIDTNGTDSFIVSLYLFVCETVVATGETLSIAIDADSVKTFYAAETTVTESSSKTIIIQRDTLQLIMTRLNAETTNSFNLHNQDSYPAGVADSNPVLVGSGVIRSWANLGYDTMGQFAVRIDTFANGNGSGLSIDSITQVYILLNGRSDSWGAGYPDTVTLVRDNGGAESRTRWVLPVPDTRIKDTQPFQVFVEVISVRDLMDSVPGIGGYNGETMLMVMPFDSPVTSSFTSDSRYGDTHSNNIVTFAFNDKFGESVVINITTLGDTNINPDTRIGENPFKIAEGKIFGRRVGDNVIGHYGMVQDSLIYFAAVIHSAYAVNGTELNAVDTVTLKLGALGRAFNMTRDQTVTQAGTLYGHYSVRPETHLIGWQTGLVNSGTNTDTNTDTFIIEIQVRDSITEDANFTSPPKLTAKLFTDSIVTRLTAPGKPYAETQQRIITFQKKSLAIGMTTLADLTNRSPFRSQIETNSAFPGTSTIISAQFTSSQVPKDSLTVFRVGITKSPRVGRFNATTADSLLTVLFYGAPGANGTPETTIAMVFDTGSVDSSTYRLPYTITIETDQRFQVWVVAADTPTTDSKTLMVTENANVNFGDTGETLTAHIESAVAQFSLGTVGGLNLTSARMITYFYNDTVSIADSSLGNLTINPDSRLGQNPVLVIAGDLQGQRSKSGLQDTLQQIGISFAGTALNTTDSRDSVVGVFMYFGLEGDSIQFTRMSNNGWRVTLDSPITTASKDTFAIYARISETAILTGQTLVASIPSDSVHTYYTADTTTTITSQRTVTIDKTQVAIAMNDLPDSTVSPFAVIRTDSGLKADSTLIMSGTITRPVNVTDTITGFGVKLSSTSSSFGAHAIDSMVVVFAGTTPITLARSGVADSFWSFPAGLVVDSMAASQTFQVFIDLIDSERLAARTDTTGFNAIADTFIFAIVIDSVTTTFGKAGPPSDTNSSTTLTVGYTDTARITDSTMGNITVHPDTFSGNSTNPFLLWAGHVRGQNSVLTLKDTLVHIAFDITGSVLGGAANAAGRDSILSAWVWIDSQDGGGDTRRVNLSREGTDGSRWGARIDSSLPAPNTNGGTVGIRLYVQVMDTTAVAQCSGAAVTMGVSVPGDTWNFVYANETNTLVGSRTVTFGKDVATVVMPARNLSYPATIETGVLKEVMYFEILSSIATDTITRIIVEAQGLSGDTAFDTMVLVLDSGKKANVGRDERYDTQFDSQIGFFTKIGSGTGWDTWQFVPSQAYDTRLTSLYNAGGSMTLMILVKLSETAPGSSGNTIDSLQLRLPACTGVQLKFQALAPTVTLTYDSYKAISPDSNPPLAPTFLTLDVATAGQMKISFDPSPSGDTGMLGGQYNVYFDSGSGVYPDTLFQVFTHISGKTVYDTTVAFLTPDSTYRFRVEGQDAAGNKGSSLLASATFRGAATQLSPQYAAVGITQPGNGGVVYRSQTIQLVAQVTTGNFNDITSVRFDSRPAVAGGAFVSLGTVSQNDATFDANGKAYYTFITDSSHFPPVGTGAGADSYEIRAVASGAWGEDTYSVSSVMVLTTDPSAAATLNISDSQGSSSVALDPASQAHLDTRMLAADIDTTVATDLTLAEYTVSTQTTAKTLTVVTPSRSFSIGITLGKGSLATDTDRIIVAAALNGGSDTIITATKNLGIGQPRYWVDINLQSGQRTIDDGDSTLISLSYVDNNNDDIDDSFALHLDKAKIYTIALDGVTIEPVEIVRIDRTRKTVIGRVRHFSPFFLSNDTGVTNAGLNRLLVGPNPFRPHSNDFAAQGLTPGVIFKNLPPAWKVEIYSILGERVIEFSSSSTNASPTAGHIVWDGRTEAGKSVASGYYIYIVTDLGTQQRVTGKLAVIR